MHRRVEIRVVEEVAELDVSMYVPQTVDVLQCAEGVNSITQHFTALARAARVDAWKTQKKQLFFFEDLRGKNQQRST